MILKPPFLVYFQLEMLIYDLKNRNLRAIFGPRECHFDHFQGQKPVLWTFRKLFWSCSKVAWESFLTLKATILGVFLARKVYM